MSMEDLFTRSKANEGIHVPLTYPDGTESPHWLTVRGVDSDAFIKAETKGKRRLMEIAVVEETEKREEMLHENQLDVIASLICGWSFDMELTHDNVVNLLREAPQIANKVNQLASRRDFFFKKESKPSSGGPKKK